MESVARLALRPVEAAKALGVSPRALYSWVKKGRIPHTRVGKVILFSTDELRKWLTTQSRGDKPTMKESKEERQINE